MNKRFNLIASNVFIETLVRNFIAKIKFAKDKPDFIPDETHKKNPGGDYHKTPKGWGLNNDERKKKQDKKQKVELEKQKATRELDLTKSGEGEYAQEGKYIYERQIHKDDVITFMDKDGNLVKGKKFGDLSENQKKDLLAQIKVCGFIHAKGFNNYGDVNLSTFERNKKNTLRFLEELDDQNVELVCFDDVDEHGKKKYPEKQKAKVSQRLDGFIKDNRKHLQKIVTKYSQGVRSKVAIKRLDEYMDMMEKVIREACSKGGGMEDVTEADLDAYLQEDMKRLIFQEVETRKRSMGDHGIRHLVGNALNSVKILNELQNGGVNGINGKQKLLAMSTMVNHDIGYTMGQVATNAAKGTFHKSYSGIIALEEKDRYIKIFGKDDAEKMVGVPETYANGKPKLTTERNKKVNGKQIYVANDGGETDDITKAKGYRKDRPENAKKVKEKYTYTQEEAYNEDGTLKLKQEQYQNCKIKHEKGKEGVIQYHDSSNFDWKNDPVGSAVALADCTALFGEDKVQEFFLKNDKAMEEVAKMHCIMNTRSKYISKKQKQSLFNQFKKKMYSMIEGLEDATIYDKDLLHSQIDEMSVFGFSTIKDILTRSSGVLKGFHYDGKKNQMTVETEYSDDGRILEDIFGSKEARYQWGKAESDLKGNGEIKNIDGNRTLYVKKDKDNNDSSILVSISGFTKNVYKTKGVARVFTNAPTFPFKTTVARLAEGVFKKDEQSIKEFDDFEKMYDNKKDGNKKCQGEIIFGSLWEKVKKILQAVRNGNDKDFYKKLKDLGLTDKEKAYLCSFGRGKKSAKIAMALTREYIEKTRFAVRYDDFDRYTYKWIGIVKPKYVSYGEIEFFISTKEQGLYRVYLTDRKQNTKKWVESFLNRNYQKIKAIKTREQLADFLNKNFKKVKELF